MPQPGTFVGKKNAGDFPIACMPSQRNGSTSCGAIDDTRGTKVLTDSCGELYGMTNLVCLHFHTLLRASASHFPSYNDRQRKTKTGKKRLKARSVANRQARIRRCKTRHDWYPSSTFAQQCSTRVAFFLSRETSKSGLNKEP